MRSTRPNGSFQKNSNVFFGSNLLEIEKKSASRMIKRNRYQILAGKAKFKEQQQKRVKEMERCGFRLIKSSSNCIMVL